MRIYRKGLTFWWRIQSGIFRKIGNHIVLATLYTPTKKRGRIEISAKIFHSEVVPRYSNFKDLNITLEIHTVQIQAEQSIQKGGNNNCNNEV